MPDWFIPSIEEFQSERATLLLGLNRALRHYRELTVPGIGGVWFVRQLSWGVAGISLAKEYSLKPAKVANAIEALACKMEWETSDDYNKKGVRAFNRDSEMAIWSFRELSDKANYVQITYRQATVRALLGLNLTEGTRFNSMQLTAGKGRELSEAFLSQSKSKIRFALVDWVNDRKTIKRTPLIREGLSGCSPSKEEKEVVKSILCSESTEDTADLSRRRRLIKSFGGSTVNCPSIEAIKKNLRQLCPDTAQKQIDDIDIAILFDKMLDCGREVIYTCAQLISKQATPSSDKLVKNQELNSAIKRLLKAAEYYSLAKGTRHPDARKFSEEILASATDSAACLRKLILRDTNILDISGEKVIEGYLFDRRKELGSPDSPQEKVGSEESSTETKIRQLFELWGDCQ